MYYIPTECRFAIPADKERLNRFAKRLNTANQNPSLVEKAINPQLPGNLNNIKKFPVRRRSIVALHKNEIHASQLFFENQLFIDGEPKNFVYPAGPISEGLVDSRYSLFSIALLKYSLSLQPFHMALGLGSYSQTITKIFIGLGWSHAKIPFYFLPYRPNKVLKEITIFRSNIFLYCITRLILFSGIGWFVNTVFFGIKNSFFNRSNIDYEIVDTFGSWADNIWKMALKEYKVLTRKDSQTLNLLYRPFDKRYIRLRVYDNKEEIGWLLIVIKKMKNDKYFGNLTVGTIVDGLCEYKHINNVLNSGLKYFNKNIIDICVVNWSHHLWKKASVRLGFLKGPSNYIFCASRSLVNKLNTHKYLIHELHLSRGDGDGPITLVPPL